MAMLATLAFVVGAVTVLYTFAGYPLHIASLAKLVKFRNRPTPQPNPTSELPEVTVVLAVHNEASRIRQRIENLLESDYPSECLRILIVSDGSTDDTIANIPVHPRVQLLERQQRSGKPTCLNAGVEAARTEIVVFADARQRFEPGAIRALARNFSDPAVGAVSGALEIASSGSNTGAGVDIYWTLEKWIRSSEAQIDSAIGCTGAIYAIRRNQFVPLAPDTLLDDVVIPMQILLRGSRVLFEASAIAWDPQPLEPEAEQRRKKRTLAGNFQMLFQHPRWLFPWKNRLWWQLLAHKYLRLAAPWFLMLTFASNAMLLGATGFRVFFACQLGFYILAAAAPLLPRTKLVAIPAGFVFLNWMTVRAFFHYLTSRDLQRWEVHRLR